MHGAFRGGSFRAAFRALRDDRLARWLSADVPAAVVAGAAELPPRPDGRARRLGRLRR
jgi:hypothetical protein